MERLNTNGKAAWPMLTGRQPGRNLAVVFGVVHEFGDTVVVFASGKTEAEIQKLTAQLPDSGKQSVNQALILRLQPWEFLDKVAKVQLGRIFSGNKLWIGLCF